MAFEDICKTGSTDTRIIMYDGINDRFMVKPWTKMQEIYDSTEDAKDRYFIIDHKLLSKLEFNMVPITEYRITNFRPKEIGAYLTIVSYYNSSRGDYVYTYTLSYYDGINIYLEGTTPNGAVCVGFCTINTIREEISKIEHIVNDILKDIKEAPDIAFNTETIDFFDKYNIKLVKSEEYNKQESVNLSTGNNNQKTNFVKSTTCPNYGG